METETRYVLATPVDYAHEGSIRQAAFVALREPTGAQMALVAKIRQTVSRAYYEHELRSAQVESAPNDDATVVPMTIDERARAVVTLLASSSIDLAQLFDWLGQLFAGGDVAMIDGETRLSPGVLAKMSARDVERLFGTYLATFPLAS